MIHPKRYYGKSCFLLLLLLLLLLRVLLTHKYLFCLFLKSSFSSLEAVLTCTFLGTFCLKPHLRRIQGICEYNDILYSFSLLSLPQPALWSNPDCFLLTLILCCTDIFF